MLLDFFKKYNVVLLSKQFLQGIDYLVHLGLLVTAIFDLLPEGKLIPDKTSFQVFNRTQ